MRSNNVDSLSGIDICLIKASDLTPLPWKNGGGVTRQISIHPEGATLDTFMWRTSVAVVKQPGPFSNFNDIDRFIVLTHGDSITLVNTTSHERHALQRWQPFSFSGETAISAELPHGPTQDFNLMVRRGQGQGQLSIKRVAQHLVLHPGSAVLHCAAGSFKMSFVSTDQPVCVLQTGDSLRVNLVTHAPLRVEIEPEQDHAVLIDARITAAER